VYINWFSKRTEAFPYLFWGFTVTKISYCTILCYASAFAWLRSVKVSLNLHPLVLIFFAVFCLFLSLFHFSVFLSPQRCPICQSSAVSLSFPLSFLSSFPAFLPFFPFPFLEVRESREGRLVKLHQKFFLKEKDSFLQLKYIEFLMPYFGSSVCG